jgi:hypothetical protein
MNEATFQFNNKGENILLTDLRAAAVRISNIILSRKTGLPNNSEIFMDIKSWLQERADSSNIALLKQQMSNSISKYLGTNCDVDITKIPKSINDNRQLLQITVNIGTNGDNKAAITYTTNASGDGLIIKDISIA